MKEEWQAAIHIKQQIVRVRPPRVLRKQLRAKQLRQPIAAVQPPRARPKQIITVAKSDNPLEFSHKCAKARAEDRPPQPAKALQPPEVPKAEPAEELQADVGKKD